MTQPIETPERSAATACPDIAEIMSRYVLNNAWLQGELDRTTEPKEKKELHEQIKFNNYLLVTLARLKTGQLPGMSA